MGGVGGGAVQGLRLTQDLVSWTLLCDIICKYQLCLTLQTLAHQVPLSMELSRQEYWTGLPFPSPGDLPNPGTEPASHVISCIAGRLFTH